MGVQAGDGAGLTDAADRDGVQARVRANSVPRLVVGRVGALAAALGIGAAVFAIPGLAAADAGGSGGASGSASSSGSPSSGSRGPAHGSSRTAVKSSTSTVGVPGASAAEAVAGRGAGTGRQASVSTQATNDFPNSIASEAGPRRGVRDRWADCCRGRRFRVGQRRQLNIAGRGPIGRRSTDTVDHHDGPHINSSGGVPRLVWERRCGGGGDHAGARGSGGCRGRCILGHSGAVRRAVGERVRRAIGAADRRCRTKRRCARSSTH